MKKNWLKILIIFFVNVIVIIFCFILIDYIIADKDYNNYIKNLEKSNNSKQNPSRSSNYHYSLRIYPFNKLFYLMDVSNFPDEKKQKSIIVFGCSFAQGSVQKNFEYLLSEKTNRIVFNFGFSGLGIANMYAQISNPRFERFILKVKPKYVIYIFITDHVYRLYSDKYGIKEQIYIDDDVLPKNIKTYLLRQLSRFYIGRNILERNIFEKKLIKENNNKHFNLIKLYFEKSKEKLEKYYPDIKFIIIKYPSRVIGNPDWNAIYESERWQELEKEGFKIIDLKSYVNVDLTDSKYIFDDGHPTTEAWEIITDKLSKDINNNFI